MGIVKTKGRLLRDFWWPSLYRDVECLIRD